MTGCGLGTRERTFLRMRVRPRVRCAQIRLGAAIGQRICCRGFSQKTSVSYAPLRKHAMLWDPERVAEWIHPAFQLALDTLNQAHEHDAARVARAVVDKEASDVYSFRLLRDEVCSMLVEEIEHFQATGLPARRPNSMNNYGIVLNEIGMQPSLTALQQRVLQPFARALFPDVGSQLDDHHTFCVSYRPEEDRGLDMHTDDSDVTLNVCLGREFEASGLTFCGMLGEPAHRQVSHRYAHRLGRAIVHLGRRRHGADDILSGHRVNMIMWSYNRAHRQTERYRFGAYAAETCAPDPVCVSFTHDRDYEAIRGVARPAAGGATFARTSWCPPRHAEYPGFEGCPGRYAHIDPVHADLPFRRK